MVERTFPGLPSKIRKRDGSLENFDQDKIRRALQKAAYDVFRDEIKTSVLVKECEPVILEKIVKTFRDNIPSVEEIQDIVEETLMEAGHSLVARSYILYRKEHQDIRQVKKIFGVRDDLKLPLNTLIVLKKRYLLRDEDQRIIESPKELFSRVAHAVAEAESGFKAGPISQKEAEEEFFRMMANLEFLPNSPTLMNAGTPLGQLSACFVLPVEDSMEGIFESLKNMAKIHQSGGGTGFDFSKIRPKDDLVTSTKGKSSGPLSFMRIFNQATGVIVQGGKRRGANMGILRFDHPDIVEFVEAKLEERSFSNFNFSVGVTDTFMDAVEKNTEIPLINPRTKKKAKSIKAKSLFDLIAYTAWKSGDPGLIFLDEINKHNPLLELGLIEATNPCGEIPLLPYESCNLGSINLARFVHSKEIDWQKLRKTIDWGVRFLDNIVEVNQYPLPQIREITMANRKIGLGVMGFADMLIKLKIPYGSEEAVTMASKLMRFFHEVSLKSSQNLAQERGPFPNFPKSVHADKNIPIRNATLNTVAPTGTISIIAGCSSGIEPVFALSYIRTVLSGTHFFEVHPLFKEELERRGIHSKELIASAGALGSIQNISGIPDDLKNFFITSFDVNPIQHLKIQAAFQKYTDNSVSKTINLPEDAPVDDVKEIFFKAYSLRCKGITVYRYGAKRNQVLMFDTRSPAEREDPFGMITATGEFSGGCYSGSCQF